MGLLIKLAWRNIWRNKRRTILTILAVVFATFLSLLQRGVADGTWEYNIKNMLDLFTGYIQIQRIGYNDNPKILLSFRNDERIRNILSSNIDIINYSERILSNGLISYRQNTSGIVIIGINPAKEMEISQLHKKIIKGTYLNQGEINSVVVGYKLLDKLKAEIGDTIVILAQGFDGVLGNMKLKICGAVKFNLPEFDAYTVFINTTTADELLALDDRISIIAVKLGNLKSVSKVTNQLNFEFQKNNIDNLVALRWDEVLTELKEAREFDRIGDYFFLTILLVIVSFGILNTVTMAVTERFKEFGINLSIGMKSIKIFFLVLIESGFITLIGLVFGNLFGYLLNYLLEENPIILTAEYENLYAEYGFLPQIPGSTDINNFINVSLVVLVISILASLYPAYKAYRLEPLKGIRYT